MTARSLLLPLGLALATLAHAGPHDNIQCTVPKAEWQPQMALQAKLTSEGWKVRRVKVENGCYEVYGFDAKGARAEVFFNPKTFEKIAEVAQ